MFISKIKFVNKIKIMVVSKVFGSKVVKEDVIGIRWSLCFRFCGGDLFLKSFMLEWVWGDGLLFGLLLKWSWGRWML